MKLKSSTLLLAFGSALFLSVSCSNDAKEGALSDSAKDSLTVTGIKIKGQNFMVPSPMILAEIIKKSGALYDKKMMNSVASLSNYSVGFKQGLNLGVYGADLGYVTMYENTGDAMEYYKTVVQLGNTLKITASFDDKLMKRFTKNVGRKDSILSLVGEAYRRSDNFLREGDQDDIAALILAGGWIESTWFALNIYKDKPSENVAVRIGEQKGTASGILKVLVDLNKPELENLVKLFSELNDVYQTIEIKYTFTEPKTDEGKHLTTINGTTDVKITSEQLTELTAKVTAVRNFIIN
ncbi:MAG: hypothetical protein EXR20_04385 [Bacteroidetes bacterium]|nr:hypothetical protein [Bacteroidota bacterium]PHX82828.1 MAG: hypothetical protein CK539_02535 [Flavobacteriales bacterium]